MLIEETLSRMQRKNNSRNELQQAYNKLNQFIEVKVHLFRTSITK